MLSNMKKKFLNRQIEVFKVHKNQVIITQQYLRITRHLQGKVNDPKS